MRTLLNLLPAEKKEAIQFQLYARFLVWQLFLVFLLEIFYVGVLISMYLILDAQTTSLRSIEQSDLNAFEQERQLSDYEGKFKGTNEAIDVIGKIEANHLHFLNVFLLLDQLMPTGIHLHHLNTKDYTVMLTGTADKRDDLLALDDHLKNNKCIGKVNLPISNLFSQRDIAFQMDFDIKPECLKQAGL